MRLLKGLLLIICCAFMFCLSGGSAYAGVKINNINFDSSSGFMFLSTSKTADAADSATDTATQSGISSVVLKSPNRVFFDIPNAILTRPNESWYFKGSSITKIKVSQFTTNPNVVRVVFYYNDDFNPKKISVINVKGNILFKYGDIKLSQPQSYRAYRSEHSSVSDYIEKMVYIPASEVEPSAANFQQVGNNKLQDVQKAFSSAIPETPQPIISVTPAQESPTNFNWSKVFKLRTNFFLSRVDVKRGNILLLGQGRAEIEKPIYLSNPTRVVFDMPNTMVSQKFKNIEMQISDTETLKVGQFEPSKVRLVITTQNPQDYRPIFSGDGQGLLIANDKRMSGIKLYEKGAQTLKTTVKAINSLTDEFTLDYANSVIYSLKENNGLLELLVYNATGFNEEFFKSAINSTKLASTQGGKMSIGGVRYVFKLTSGAEVDSYVKEDGRQLRIVIKNPKPVQITKPTPAKKPDVTYKGTGLIVIDPGHGGVDCGAIRAGINEKDINLDVSKMIAQILVKKGYKVDLTRWDDETLSLQGRVDFSDSKNASLFVSVHVNSSVSEEPKGIETHWWTDEGYELAKVVHSSFAGKVKATDRGLIKSKFYVINHTKAKSILVEIGFISNDNERNELLTKERKQKTAEGIAEGIIKFMVKEGIK